MHETRHAPATPRPSELVALALFIVVVVAHSVALVLADDADPWIPTQAVLSLTLLVWSISHGLRARRAMRYYSRRGA